MSLGGRWKCLFTIAPTYGIQMGSNANGWTPVNPSRTLAAKLHRVCFIISVALQSSLPQLHNIPLVQSHNNTSCNKKQPKKKGSQKFTIPFPSLKFQLFWVQKKTSTLQTYTTIYLHHLPFKKKHQGLHTTWCIRSIRKSRTWWTPWIRRASRITLSILSFLSRIRRNKKKSLRKWRNGRVLRFFSKCSSCWFTWNSRWWPVNSDLFFGYHMAVDGWVGSQKLVLLFWVQVGLHIL